MSDNIIDELILLSEQNTSNTIHIYLSRLATEIKHKDASMDMFFLVTMGILVYFMQCGFAFLEAGAVRSKNVTNILIKNLLDSFVGGISYFAIGYALAFGGTGNAMTGNDNFMLANLDDSKLAHFFFQSVFAATAATIASGALAERCNFKAYLIYSVIISGFTYPIVSHWCWSDSGWLKQGISVENGAVTAQFLDFAGSGVVHIVGGTTAFVGALFLGPRVGRFLKDDNGNRISNTVRGHSIPLTSLGGFVLLFGFLAFNGGSQMSITKKHDGSIVANAIVTTILCACTAAFVTLMVSKLTSPGKYWSLLETINGALTGMVANCAGCNVLYPWAGCISGIFAGLFYIATSWFVTRVGVDDPIDATAVHFGGGLWGLLSVAFLSKETGIVLKPTKQSGLILMWQIVGIIVIIIWTALLAVLMFGGLKLLKLLRVREEVEVKGLDIAKHGEPGYPLSSYGHGWNEGLPVGSQQQVEEELGGGRQSMIRQNTDDTDQQDEENDDAKSCHSKKQDKDSDGGSSESSYQVPDPNEINNTSSGFGTLVPECYSLTPMPQQRRQLQYPPFARDGDYSQGNPVTLVFGDANGQNNVAYQV